MNIQISGIRSSVRQGYDFIQEVMDQLKAVGSVTPAVTARLRASAPEIWRDHVPLLLDLAQGTLRAAAVGKDIPGWLFTTTSVQQATLPQIAAYHAEAFRGVHHVVEVCTGAGIDTLALSRVAGRVTTFEADPVLAAIAESNLERAGVANVTVVSQAVPCEAYTEALATADGLWADPSRRSSSARHRSTQEYQPPLSQFWHLPEHVQRLGIKTGPADRTESPLLDDVQQEYIGWSRECRERLLWRGCGQSGVTLVDVGVHMSLERELERGQRVPPEVRPEPGMYLIEPHPAVMASGWVSEFFLKLSASVIDARIGYGLLPTDPGPSPWYQHFKIHSVESGIDRKRIQRAIRTLGWGSMTEIKKRGIDIDPMELHSSLEFAATPGAPAGVVVLVRGSHERYTIYSERSALAVNRS
jgi:hypothetical protein